MSKDIVDLTGDIADRLISRADTLMIELHDVVHGLAALLTDPDPLTQGNEQHG